MNRCISLSNIPRPRPLLKNNFKKKDLIIYVPRGLHAKPILDVGTLATLKRELPNLKLKKKLGTPSKYFRFHPSIHTSM